ncbi:hypothetical protein WG922_07730 [Ramlibacter sp. AN1015]|uniref:hypothetical protein n=1 Tax=Ramlibacter sp. AN1015 TaxID=3133428 RepID=UPI0030C4666C
MNHRNTPVKPISFPLGRLTATANLLRHMEQHGIDPLTYLSRHASGDWGDLGKQDKLANDVALVDGTRILSKYVLPTGEAVYVITEWDRSITTMLFSSEY